MLPQTVVHWQSSVGVGDKFGVEQLFSSIPSQCESKQATKWDIEKGSELDFIQSPTILPINLKSPRINIIRSISLIKYNHKKQQNFYSFQF